jgi:hypothetical protein
MNVIVGESLILTRLADLRVLEAAFRLPHEMILPDVMFADTLFELGGYGRPAFVKLGARVGHLDSEGVELARTYQVDYPALSTTEAFALVLAEAAGDASTILLTAEPLLCSTAEAHRLEVRGLLWILDEMHRHGIADGVAARELARAEASSLR